MISREKLEELIEKGETVWRLLVETHINLDEVSKLRVVQPLVLTEEYDITDDGYIILQHLAPAKPFAQHWWESIALKDLFETEEEAEWVRVFQEIERTETLSLPSWEELNQQWNGYNFTDKDGLSYSLVVAYGLNKNIHIMDENLDCPFYTKDITKENYIKACKMAKKLFLGEDLGDEI